MLTAFERDHAPACARLGVFLDEYAPKPFALAASADLASAGFDAFAATLTGAAGAGTLGRAIVAGCPAGHPQTIDCVAAAAAVGGALAAATVTLERLGRLDCLPHPGWTQCRQLGVADIRIMATAAATPKAIDAAAHMYDDVMGRFRLPAFDPHTLDGNVVYLTNGEPWSVLSKISPVNTMMGFDPDGTPRGDEIRGGAGGTFHWISEQMICKTGVATRNAAYAEGRRSSRDDTYRSFDQVVHEFGHVMHQRYGIEPRVREFYAASDLPFEEYAWAVQDWFDVPNMNRRWPGEPAFIGEALVSATTYSCAALYPPDGTVGIDEDVSDEFGRLAVLPNPADVEVRASFTLTQDAELHVGLLDVQGREALALPPGRYAAGETTVSLPTAGLPAGMYQLVVRGTGGGQATAWVLVVH